MDFMSELGLSYINVLNKKTAPLTVKSKNIQKLQYHNAQVEFLTI